MLLLKWAQFVAEKDFTVAERSNYYESSFVKEQPHFNVDVSLNTSLVQVESVFLNKNISSRPVALNICGVLMLTCYM